MLDHVCYYPAVNPVSTALYSTTLGKDMRILCLILSLCCTLTALGEDKILNVYNWNDYLPKYLIRQFEDETGIKVNYSEFDSNDTLYAKIKSSKQSNYDIIAPSCYMVDRMREEKMLHKIDKKLLTNFKHLDSFFLNRRYDPNNEYSIPYLWTTTGIVINTRYHKLKDVQRWADLWNPKYRNQLILLDEWRDIFSSALLMHHFEVNTKDVDEIKIAYLSLVDLMQNVRVFSSTANANIFIDEDITIGISWAGDAFLANQENPHIVYIYPQEGFTIELDNLAIPHNAKHPIAAHQFMNFVLRPEIAAQLPLRTGHSTPNKSAIKLLPGKLRFNPIINP
ncbi:MAG: spermidine/putrescine ABC transporter substrate-binding protein, partial [Pseudomonadota bacterium]|nr:spermidine/putrescine ABC transporter substrate-binding protein [Pseudomonadota bacterium]